MKSFVLLGLAMGRVWLVVGEPMAPPEAFVMKSWTSLKDSMSTIGTQVGEILEVRKDLKSIQDDLLKQEDTWKAAEATIEKNTDTLKAKAEKLVVEVHKGASLSDDVTISKQRLATEIARRKALGEKAEHVKVLMEKEMQSLDARKASLIKMIAQERNRTAEEIEKAHDQQRELQQDAGTLQLKVSDLEDVVKAEKEALEIKKQKHQLQMSEREKQLQTMYTGLKGIIAKLDPSGNGIGQQQRFLTMKAELQDKLKQETATIIQLQLQHQELIAKCSEELQAREQARSDEESKHKARYADAEQYCAPVEAEHQALTQQLTACTGS